MGLSLVAFAAVAQFGVRILNPHTYRSPSGRVSLWVNPDRASGKGSATYRLSVNGKNRWTKSLPFTIKDGGVGEDGTIAGYGYTERSQKREASLFVAILRPEGTIALYERHALANSPLPDLPDEPTVEGAIFDSANDRMIIRTETPGPTNRSETWWTYRLSTGKRLADLHPSLPINSSYIADARPIPGTALILLQWLRHDDHRDLAGATFSLVDESARSVWQLDLPNDYLTTPENREHLRLRIMREGAILGVGQARFELLQFKEGLRVTYAIQDNEVRRDKQSRYLPPTPPNSRSPSLPPIGKLTRLGKAIIPVRASESPVHDVESFFLLPKDRIVFLQGGRSPAIVEVDGQGKQRRRISLGWGVCAPQEIRRLAWTGGSRFVLIRSSPGKTSLTQAWQVDLDLSRKILLRGFVSYPIEAIAGRPDGSFAVTSIRHYESSYNDGISFFDGRGQRQWRRTFDQNLGGRPEDLQSLGGLGFDRRGRVVVLDDVEDVVHWFDAKGRHLRRLDIKKIDRQIDNLTGFSCGPDGGLTYVDSGQETIVRLTRNGSVRSRWRPRLANGKPIEPVGTPQTDSKGRLWISNGYALYRLNARGVADRGLGADKSQVVQEVGALLTSPSKTIYVLDAVSHHVHTFDRNGKPGTVFRPRVDDFADRPDIELALSPTEDVYLQVGAKQHLIHFTSSGKRLPDQKWPPSGRTISASRSQPVPKSWRWWSTELLDEQGQVRAEVNRWPNGDWLTYTKQVSAPDGRLLVVDFGSDEKPSRFAIYSASGQPQMAGTLAPGFAGIYVEAFDGKTIYYLKWGALTTIGLDGQPKGRYLFPRDEGRIFPTLDGFAWFDNIDTVVWFAGLP